MKWPPDFTKQPFYSLETPYALMEMEELFDGCQARDEYFHLALCVVRENDKHPRSFDRPKIHKKAWCVRYTFKEGIADHIIIPSKEGWRRVLVVDGESMKHRILEWARKLAIFNPPLERYID